MIPEHLDGDETIKHYAFVGRHLAWSRTETLQDNLKGWYCHWQLTKPSTADAPGQGPTLQKRCVTPLRQAQWMITLLKQTRCPWLPRSPTASNANSPQQPRSRISGQIKGVGTDSEWILLAGNENRYGLVHKKILHWKKNLNNTTRSIWSPKILTNTTGKVRQHINGLWNRTTLVK